MRSPTGRGLQGLVLSLASLLILVQCTDSDRMPNDRAPSPGDWVDHLPMPTDYFVENVGQIGNGEVLYYHRAGGMQVGFAEGGVLLRVMEPVEEGSAGSGEIDSPRTFTTVRRAPFL